MSAFLGPIHTWLFGKIKLQDELTAAILAFAEANNYMDAFPASADVRFGTLEAGKLADIIDESNIHGWLQERVSLVENRLAYVVTMITDEHPERIIALNEAVYEFGKSRTAENGISVKEAYGYLENILLNGMPCDHVNEVTNETDDSISWVQAVDIHAPYWQMIHGNVEYYYAIRESLCVGMLENSGIGYYQTGEQSFELRKEVE